MGGIMTPDPVPPARRDEGEELNDAIAAYGEACIAEFADACGFEPPIDYDAEPSGKVLRDLLDKLRAAESAAFARGRAENNDDFVRQVARDLSEIAGIAWNPPEVKLRDLASAIEQRGYQRGIEEAAKVACWMCQLGDLPLVDGCHYLNDDLAKQRMSGVRCHGYPIRAMLGGADREGNRG